MANVVEQLRQIEGFDSLPQARQEALIVDALAKEAKAGVGSYERPLRVGEPQPIQDRIDPAMLQAARQYRPSPQTYQPTNEGNYVLQDRPQAPTLEPSLEETFTRPSETVPLILSAVGGGLPGAGMQAGSALAQRFTSPTLRTALPYVGAALGSEAANVTGKVMSGQSLAPDLSDVASTAVPLALGAWPMAKAAAGEFAATTHVGKVAKLDAATKYVDAANADLQAKWALARQADEARQSVLQAGFNADMKAHAALLELGKADKIRRGEELRRAQAFIKEGNMDKARQVIADLPNVPTDLHVKEAYADVAEQVLKNNLVIELPEVQKLKSTFVQEAAHLQSIAGHSPLAAKLEALANAGAGGAPLSLADVHETIGMVKARIGDLSGEATAAAKEQRRTYVRMLAALDEDMKNIAAQNPEIKQWKSLVDTANATYLKRQTVKDLEQFINSQLYETSAVTGEQIFTPKRFLDSLEKPANAELKKYMQATKFKEEGDRSLYDITRDNFTQHSKEAYDAAEKLRLDKRALDAVKPEAPTPPPPSQMGPAPRPLEVDPKLTDTRSDRLPVVVSAGTRVAAGIAAAALYGGGYSPYATGLAIAGAGLPSFITAYMMSPQGQRTLLRIMTEYGGKLTPEAVGFLTAAARATGERAPDILGAADAARRAISGAGTATPSQ